MILSSCHHYSLNNDCHCHYHCCCDCHCHYMQRIYVYFILSSLALSYLVLFCFVLSWLEGTSITIVIIGMTLYELVLHYIIISYHIISYVLLFYLHILFYSILLYFKLIRFDSFLFYFIEFDLLYCSV